MKNIGGDTSGKIQQGAMETRDREVGEAGERVVETETRPEKASGQVGKAGRESPGSVRGHQGSEEDQEVT